MDKSNFEGDVNISTNFGENCENNFPNNNMNSKSALELRQ